MLKSQLILLLSNQMMLLNKFIFLILLALSIPANARQDIHLWRHFAAEAEIKASLDRINHFNNSQNKWNIIFDFIPELAYTQSIKAAAQAELLPCIIEVDQPNVPNFAWQGFLQPLDNIIDKNIIESTNNSGKGSYKDRLYSLGPLDVSLALFTRKSLINKMGMRYPTISHPWSKDEFMSFLDSIKATGNYKYPFDMKVQDKSEWLPYAFIPLMVSWGADVIDRTNLQTVDGVLNSEKSIQFGQWIQSLVNNNYISPNNVDGNGFINSEVAIQYDGSWALNRYYQVYKDDLAILPVPDLGHGPQIGGGSWHWAITNTCQYPEAAAELITFLMTIEEQNTLSSVIGIFPTNSDVAELTTDYAVGGKWRILFDFSKQFALMRPKTPAYADISSNYKKAISDIINGMQPSLALDLAVERIEAEFAQHHNYSPIKNNQ